MEGESLQAALKFLDSWLEYRSRQIGIPGFCIDEIGRGADS
jgi:hypothetical protein